MTNELKVIFVRCSRKLKHFVPWKLAFCQMGSPRQFLASLKFCREKGFDLLSLIEASLAYIYILLSVSFVMRERNPWGHTFKKIQFTRWAESRFSVCTNSWWRNLGFPKLQCNSVLLWPKPKASLFFFSITASFLFTMLWNSFRPSGTKEYKEELNKHLKIISLIVCGIK